MDHFQFSFTEHDDYFEVTLTGAPTLSDFDFIMDQMTESEQFTSPLRLWDLRDCELNLSTQELQDLGTLATRRDFETSRVSVLVDNDLNYGLIRIHRAYRVTEARQLNVFWDREESLKWLRSESS